MNTQRIVDKSVVLQELSLNVHAHFILKRKKKTIAMDIGTYLLFIKSSSGTVKA